jgi:hypothetical protein
MFRQDRTCPALLDFTAHGAFVYGAITLYRRTFQTVPLTSMQLKGCSPFARRY